MKPSTTKENYWCAVYRILHLVSLHAHELVRACEVMHIEVRARTAMTMEARKPTAIPIKLRARMTILMMVGARTVMPIEICGRKLPAFDQTFIHGPL